MRWVSFLSRVAFVCNLFFVFTVILHFNSFLQDQAIISTIVIIGYALSVFVFNPLANISCLAILLFRKKLFELVPKWLVIANFIFLLLQITYVLFFLNDTVYN
jgi:hypothetical protein